MVKGKVVKYVVTKIVSEQLIKEIVIILLRKLVLKTETKTDDEILKKIEEAMM